MNAKILTCTLLLGAAWCSARSWGADSQRSETRSDGEAQGSRYTPEELAQLPAAMLVLEQIVKVDDGSESVAVDNSVVRINTTEIDKVVARGPSQLPLLVAIMKAKGLSFDTFIRCYSAAEQILRKEDPQARIYWVDGASWPGDGIPKVIRFEERAFQDEKFRKRVTDDIVAKMEQLRAGNDDKRQHHIP